MEIKQSFSLAIKSLKASKLRSLLTMLGMIIGVASVIVLVSLGNGVNSYIEDSFNSIGANTINAVITYRGSNIKLGYNEVNEFVEKIPEINRFSPVISKSGIRVKHNTEDYNTSVVGVNEYYGEIRNKKLVSGRFLEYIDVETIQKVCVIGPYVRDELMEGEDPIGKKIKINGEVFTIIGMFEEKQEGIQGGEDDIIVIPYTVSQRLFKVSKISNFLFETTSTEASDEADYRINEFLFKTYGDKDDYVVVNSKAILDQLSSVTAVLTNFLVAIASISLIVGGIGIMNIMLVSVTERTKEIGIRKALGAKRKDILRQFVIEAITTSAIGGIIGIIVGIIFAILLSKIASLTPTITVSSVLIAFFVSGMIGVIFGYLPADKAAKLNPIDALRYE